MINKIHLQYITVISIPQKRQIVNKKADKKYVTKKF